MMWVFVSLLTTAGRLSAAEPKLTIQLSDTNVVVTFPGRLQSAAEVAGPFTNVANGLSPYTAPQSAVAQFWRSVSVKRETISIGRTHVLLLRNDGTLWGWGENSSGQLGTGSAETAILPVQIGNDRSWLSVSAGEGLSLALQEDGSLWGWGFNHSGQLGDGLPAQVTGPSRIGHGNDWLSVAACGLQSLGVRRDGRLWGWGAGWGAPPVPIGTRADWDTVVSNHGKLTAKRTDGSYWTLGSTNDAWLGHPTEADGPLVRLGGTGNWIDLSVGWGTLAVKDDGSLWGWGENGNFQIGTGLPALLKAPVAITPGIAWKSVAIEGASLAIRADGTLWTWGMDVLGWPGFEPHVLVNNPVQVGTSSNWVKAATGIGLSLALQADGSVWTWAGLGGYPPYRTGRASAVRSSVPVRIGDEPEWKSVTAGYDFVFATRQDGSLWGWGDNLVGQLGNQSRLSTNRPARLPGAAPPQELAAGSGHSLLIRGDGSLWATGSTFFGELGTGKSIDLFPRPNELWTDHWEPVAPGTTWLHTIAGDRFSLGIQADGSLWSWGSGAFGELGQPGYGRPFDLIARPQRVGTANDWRPASAGFNHVIALRADGSLWGWGRNESGQAGQPASPDFFSGIELPTRIGSEVGWKTIAAGGMHSVAIREDGTLWVWGSNYDGALGTGSTNNTHVPTQVGGDSDWRFIAAGSSHTVALRSNGSLWVWGGNQSGQLGLGHLDRVLTPTPVEPGAKWTAVAAKGNFTVAIRSDGTLWGWGSNAVGPGHHEIYSAGQIGQPVPWLPHPIPGNDWRVP